MSGLNAVQLMGITPALCNPQAIHIVNGENAFSELGDAVVVPSMFDTQGSKWWLKRTQGVFTKEMAPVDHANELRGVRRIWWPTAKALGAARNPTVTLDRAIYGGTVFPHFGHFMLDTLKRVYPAMALVRAEGVKVLFHLAHYDTLKDPFQVGYMKKLMDLCGLRPEDVIFVKEVTRVRQLILYRPQFSERNFCDINLHRNMAAAAQPVLAEVTARPQGDELVFVSRSRLKSGTNRFVGDQEIDTYAAGIGYRVIYPEEMDMLDQIAIFRTSRAVAGFQSSFFHLKCFLERPVRAHVMAPAYPLAFNSNFLNIDLSSGFDDRYHMIDAQRDMGAEDAGFDAVVEFNLDQVRAALDEVKAAA